MESLLIIKTISKFLNYDFSFFILCFLSFLTGLFKQFLIIFFLIIIHEFGHLLVAKLFKWKIDKIKIYIFGGCVKFNESLNKPIYEEFLILIAGPLFQMLGFLFLTFLYNEGLIFYKDYLVIKSYNYTLLSFNLLPIYPLDGGKIFNLLCNYFFNYKLGNKFVIIISYILSIIILIFNKNYNLFLMIILLIIEITRYLKNQNFIYNRFLLERYLNKYNFKKYKIINNYNKMYRDKRHIIKEDSYMTEKEYLKKYFQKSSCVKK